MKGQSIQLGCACGAINATLAAYGQMTHEDQISFQKRVITCETCELDRRAGLARSKGTVKT